MLSPFPGMDPFLEASGRWSDFHTTFLIALRQQLNQTLPEGFEAGSEERIYILPSEREIRPDVTVFAVATNNPIPIPRSNVAVAERITAPEAILRPQRQIIEHYLEVRDLRGPNAEIVTIIELLSPTNKQEGKGQDEYLRKQSAVLESTTHLLEIDLLRRGEHTVCLSKETLKTIGEYDYLVTLANAEDREKIYFWRLSLRNPLPTLALPLTPDVEPVALDLQAALDQCWATSRYAQTLDYSLELKPSLSPEDAIWASERVESAL
jgi:hypothetical protein